jgi:hypothetical protein
LSATGDGARRRARGAGQQLVPAPPQGQGTQAAVPARLSQSRCVVEADITRLLDWFFRVKPQRMAEQKLPNVFADPGIEDFVRSACTAPLANGSTPSISTRWNATRK